MVLGVGELITLSLLGIIRRRPVLLVAGILAGAISFTLGLLIYLGIIPLAS